MAKVTGRDAVKAYIGQLRGPAAAKMLRGAARAMASVGAEEARRRCASNDVEKDIKVRSNSKKGEISASIIVQGPNAYIGRFLEYGTAPHLITVDKELRRGRSVGRINDQVKSGEVTVAGSRKKKTLTINGVPAGTSVNHPGARPLPFLRPAVDATEAEAIAAGQQHINAHLRRGVTVADPGDDE